MAQKKLAWVIYGILLLAAVFVLGYFLGMGRAAPQIQVTVEAPSKEQTVITVPTETDPASDGIVNLNTADRLLLESLPGIGPELASRILEYRATYGPFVDKEQIMDVEGIGEGRYEQIEPWITVGGNE